MDQWALACIVDEKAEFPLVVSDRPLFWYLHDIASISTEVIEKKQTQFDFHYRMKSFDPYVLEHIRVDPVTGEESKLSFSLDSVGYHSEEVAWYPYKPYHYARLSKVIGPDRKKIDSSHFNSGAGSKLRAYPLEYWLWMRP